MRLRMWRVAAAGLAWLACAGAARASPGAADVINDPGVEKGQLSAQVGFAGLLAGRTGEGDGAAEAEVGYGFSNRFGLTVVAGFADPPRSGPMVSSVEVQALYNFGRVAGVETGLRLALSHGMHGEDDGVEVQALFMKQAGPFEGRFNLIAGKSLAGGRHGVDLGYAVLAVMRAGPHLQLGAKALGGFATDPAIDTSARHYVGPTAVAEVPLPRALGAVRLEGAWMAALGSARVDSRGAWSLIAQWERAF